MILAHKLIKGSTLFEGDVLKALRRFPAESVQTCVTSPPYWGLRDYGVPGQLGLEPTPDEYVAHMVEVFAEVRRVLREDGTLWLNLGDSYAGPNNGYSGDDRPSNKAGSLASGNRGARAAGQVRKMGNGLKQKDLVGIPWRVAFALQADGWYLRSDIIWHKPNPMPESVTDRPTKAHEYIFLMSKSPHYFYDIDAIREPLDHPNRSGTNPRLAIDNTGLGAHGSAVNGGINSNPLGRNKRTVWTVTPKPYKGAHFATFPPALIEPCILAGTPVGGVVLDPFAGSGTTLAVAIQHGRRGVGIELNPAYITLAIERISAASNTALRGKGV
jgi:DNA modification methylase